MRRVRTLLLCALAVAALAVAAPSALAISATGTVNVSATDPTVGDAISKAKLCVSGYGYDASSGWWTYVSIPETPVNGDDGSFSLALSGEGWYYPQVAACAANAGDWDANVEPTTVQGVWISEGYAFDPITVSVAGGVTGLVAPSAPGTDLEGLVCVSAYPSFAAGGDTSAGGGTSTGGGGTGTGDGRARPTRASATGQSQYAYDRPLEPVGDGTFSYGLTGLTPGSDYVIGFQKCSTSASAQRVEYAQDAVAAINEASSLAGASDAGTTTVVVADLASITGTIKDGTGTLLSGICVNAHTAWNSNAWGWGSTTSIGGSFTLTGLNPGVYDIDFYACGAGGAQQEGGGTRGNAPTTRAGTGTSPGTSPGMGGGASYLPTSVSGVVVADGEAKTLDADVVMLGAGSITGTVRRSDGSALQPGDMVCIWAQIPWNRSNGWAGAGSFGWTSAMGGGGPSAGVYTISGLKSGSYTITFMPCSSTLDSPAGKLTGKAVIAGQATTGVDFQFTAPARISGHVQFKSDGSPAENVCVQAQRTPYDPTSPSFGWAMTDSSGDYDMGGLGTGTYTVSFWPCGMGASSLIGTSKDVAATAGQTADAGTTEMEAGARITGKVLDKDGNPASGVWVWVSKSAYSWTGGSYGSAMTDSAGEFTVDGLSTGDFKVGFYVWSGAYAAGDGMIIPSSTAHIASLDTDNPIDASCASGPTAHCVQFMAAKSISGTVTMTGGTPVPGACVSVQPADDSWSMGAWGGAVTDGSGAYTISGLGSLDNFILHVDPCWQSTGTDLGSRWYNGKATRESADLIDLSGGSLTGVDVELTESGSIGGLVTDAAGDPAPGVCVAVYTTGQLADTASLPVGQAVTDGDGAYTIREIAPGADYHVAFQPCAGDNVTELRQEWHDNATTGGASSTVTVAGGDLTTVNAALAAWQTGDTCNPFLFPGGSCANAASYTSPPIAPDPDPATDGRVVEVDSPNSDSSVNVDQDMLSSDTTIEIDPSDESAPENSGDPAPDVGGEDGEAITPYIDITVTQDGVEDLGGNWATPLEIVIGVPEAAAAIADDQLPVFFDESSSTPWKAIPYIGTPDDDSTPPTLDANQQDGYWVKGTGADREIHVLTRHASTYAIFRKKDASGGGGGGGGGGVTKTKQTLASVRASLKRGKSLTLPAKSLQGLKLTWKTTTKAVCKVTKSKRGVWSVKGLKKGTCKVKGTNAGSAAYLAAAFAKSIKVTK